MTKDEKIAKLRKALAELHEASDGAMSGYVSGTRADMEWDKRISDARAESRTALEATKD